MSDLEVISVDLGASSGRVARVRIGTHGAQIVTGRRFPIAVRESGGLRWDIPRLHESLLQALRMVCESSAPPASIAVDGWGVDYGLLDGDGELMALPHCYRDPRTRGLVDRINQRDAYQRTGVPGQEINTATQLLAEDAFLLARANRMLFIPDLVRHLLTGDIATDASMASTTQLFEPQSGRWSVELVDAVGLRRDLLPPIRQHGEILGHLKPDVVQAVGLDRPIPSPCIAAHDTASAVAATPLHSAQDLYLSSGTWSCLGAEIDQPLINTAAQQLGYTNEQGLDGTTTFHRNTMGLWVLQECLRAWNITDPTRLLDDLNRLPASAVTLDLDRPELFERQDMPAALTKLWQLHGLPAPPTRTAIVAWVIDSLAATLAARAADLQQILGRDARRIVIVGGGSRNGRLCQRLADLTGLTVATGPSEATLLGNALAQARALDVSPNLTVREHLGTPTTTFDPRPDKLQRTYR